MLGEIQFVMVNGFINERPIPLVGFVGENDARQIKVVTFDDMSTVSVTELVIGDIEVGIFEAEQKTIPVFDRLSGAYVDRTQTTLSIYLNEEMLGDAGLKFLQLVMYNETGEIVKKTNQFIVRVGDSNTPVYYAPETKTVKTLETYVKEVTEEAIKLAFGLQEEVTSSSDFVNKKALYVYKGNEEDYQNDYWYYYDDTQKKWVPGGPYKNPTDEVQRLLAQKQDALTFDSTPTEYSQNPVTSDGVFRALAGHQITMDEFPINGSTNPVTSDGLYRKFGEVDAQHQSLSTRVGRIQEEQTELGNDVQQNTSNISQNAANISSQGITIAEHQTSISENADAIEEVRGIANSASNKADAVDDRLDNIIVESGTSDAETVAARTNSNTRITYTTLGQRLDSENSEIKEDLGEFKNTLSIKAYFELTDWRNGYIVTDTGRIGSSSRFLVSGTVYDSEHLTSVCTQKGDGKTYSIELDEGWSLSKVGEYSAPRTDTAYIGTVDLNNNIITLDAEKYYVFQIGKDPIENITPEDISENTIVLFDAIYTDDTLKLSGKAADAKATGDILHSIIEGLPSTNLYDGDISQGHYIDNSGVIGNSTRLCYTNTYYPVNENDKFIAGTGENTRAQLRYVTAYDAEKNVLSTKGLNGGYLYTTPEGVSFVRFTFYLADVQTSDFRLNKSAFLLPYEPYGQQVVPKGYENTEKILNEPLSTLPDYIINSLAYKPLGALSKPYICLVSDDGDEDMVTYSIPMVEQKGVPATWAIMSTSEIFTSANSETDIATVADSVTNYGCAISQHGGTNWTEYTEEDLNEFFEREKAFLASHGFVAKSAVIPSHYMSELVCAVAGGKYGVCRAGLGGQDAHGNTFEHLVKPYPNYTCGARTNIYGLTSQNVANLSQAQAQASIDYVKANNGIAIFYWHENSLDSTKKQRIEDAIDYGLSLGIEFITLDKIATIT